MGCCLHTPVEKEMATHSSMLAWRIPGTEEPGGLPSTGAAQSRTRLMRRSSSISSTRSTSQFHLHSMDKLQNLQDLLYNENVRCSKIIKNFQTTTAEH